jgi:hypothetical protein
MMTPDTRADRPESSLQETPADTLARARQTSPATNSVYGGDNLDMQSTLQALSTAASHPPDVTLSANAAPRPTSRAHRDRPTSSHDASDIQQASSWLESSGGQQRQSSSEVPPTRSERVQETYAANGNVCSVCQQGSSQPDWTQTSRTP